MIRRWIERGCWPRSRSAIGLVLLGLVWPVMAEAGSMVVQVRVAKVRAEASNLARIVASLEYGAVVEVGATQNGWRPVTLPGGGTGWLHESALSSRRAAMQAGDATAATGVGSDEVALAGKGLNEQVEKALREKGVDYTWVDRMAGFEVTPEAMASFRQAGGLKGDGK